MVRELTSGDLDEVVDVLVESFYEYPTMRYLLDYVDDYDRALPQLIRRFAGTRIRDTSRILGIGEPLEAVALVDLPEAMEGVSAPSELGPDREPLPDGAKRRLRTFEEAITPLEPDEHFHYVGMVGVRPEAQKSGQARRLLEHVFEISRDHETSTGVLLTTEDRTNVPFYEHLGFKLLGDVNTADGGLHSWTFFRRTGG